MRLYSLRCLHDYYSILGVPRTATAADIKHSYYNLSKKLHPDHNTSDAQAHARFAELNQAYHVLSEVREWAWDVKDQVKESAVRIKPVHS